MTKFLVQMKKKITNIGKRERERGETNKQNHTWAGKKAIITQKKPRGNIQRRGEGDSNKHFNPVKNYFVFHFFFKTNSSLRASNCNSTLEKAKSKHAILT